MLQHFVFDTRFLFSSSFFFLSSPRRVTGSVCRTSCFQGWSWLIDYFFGIFRWSVRGSGSYCFDRICASYLQVKGIKV